MTELKTYEFIKFRPQVDEGVNQAILDMAAQWPHQTQVKRLEKEEGQKRQDFWLNQSCAASYGNLKKQILEYSQRVDPKLRMHRGWCQNYAVGQTVARHSHDGPYSPPGVKIAGVYYAAGGGFLILHDTEIGDVEIPTNKGDLIFFRADVWHSAAPNPGPDRRVCVATNFSHQLYQPNLLPFTHDLFRSTIN